MPARAAKACSRRSSSFSRDAAVAGILERTAAQTGDLIFFGADSAKVVSDALGALRLKVGQDLGLVDDGWRPLWVVDFPMFEWDADERSAGWPCITRSLRPRNDDPAQLKADPGSAVARAYDMVLNGSEIGGGSVRIHRNEMQSKVFELLGIGAEEARAQVRLPARCAQVRLPAARRHRVRTRSPGRC